MKNIVFAFLVVVVSILVQAQPQSAKPVSLDVKGKAAAVSHRLFRVRVESKDAIFKGGIPGDTFNRTKDDVDVYFTLNNDLSLLNVINVAPKDDDYGYTHGYTASVGGSLPSDHYLRFEYSSDLYTRPVDLENPEVKTEHGQVEVKQYFVNDNVARFVIDNINQGKLFYWRGELGWEKLDNRKTNSAAAASRQQEVLHELLNSSDSGSTKKPIYVTDKPTTKEGLVVGAYAGLQKYFKFDKSICSYGVRAEVGQRENEIKGADYSEVAAFGNAICQSGPKSISYRLDVGVREQLHDEGRQEKFLVDFSVGVKTWRVGLKVERIKDDLHNYMEYNIPNIKTGDNDATSSIYIHKKF